MKYDNQLVFHACCLLINIYIAITKVWFLWVSVMKQPMAVAVSLSIFIIVKQCCVCLLYEWHVPKPCTYTMYVRYMCTSQYIVQILQMVPCEFVPTYSPPDNLAHNTCYICILSVSDTVSPTWTQSWDRQGSPGYGSKTGEVQTWA